jgi:hypothetical protein
VSLSSFRASISHLAVCFAAVLFVVISVTLVHAQERDKAVIVGTITDSSKAVILNATVTIRDAGTNATYVVKSDSKGFYTSPSLQIGTYDVTAEKKGFETMSEPNIVLDVGSRAEINFSMVPGSVKNEVVVTAVSPSLNTTSGAISYVVDQRTIEDLPLNGGNALALAALLPGVVNAFGANTSGFNDRGTQLSSVRIGGGAVGAYSNTLDGASNQITYLGEVAINPQADSISQFRSYNGTTPAQYGFTSGGAIDIATRAGTNSIHGSLYEFLRNDAVDAENYFASTQIHKPELRYNRFGASLNGPLQHDKLFYFVNGERYELVQTNPSYTTVPTALERAGDFSNSFVLGSTQVTDPTTGIVSAQPTCLNVSIYSPVTGLSGPFANAKIPTNYLDQSALAIQNVFYPLPNNDKGLYNSDGCTRRNNYVGNAKLVSHQQLAVGRLDYQATGRDIYFLRYGYYGFYTNNNTVFPNPVAGARYDTPVNQIATFGYTRVLSATTLNDLRINGLRAHFSYLSGSHGYDTVKNLGMGVTGVTLPYINNGQVGFNTTDGYRAATQFQVVDTLSKQIHRHSLMVGVDLRFNQAENNQNNYPSGILNFAQQTTSSSAICPNTGASCTGDIYASYLLGLVGSATYYVTSPATFRSSSVTGYIQDDWRAASGLTLNIGLRYDYQQQPFEIRNRTSNFDITRGDPVNGYYGAMVYSGVGGYGRTFNKENYKDFSPRVGFAYNVPNSANTVIRGGYSVYYSSTANISFGGSTNGFAQSITTYNSITTNSSVFPLENGPLASDLLQNQGAKCPVTTPPTIYCGPAAFLGTGTVFYQEPHQRTPMSQVFTLSWSKPFKSGFVMDITYLGNKGNHFVQPNYNMNQPNPSKFATPYYSQINGIWKWIDPLQTPLVTNPYAGAIPGNNGAANVTQFNLDRPYPYYAGVLDYQPRNGNYFGNYMYVSVQRRVSKGTQIIGSFTWGKLMTDPIYVPLSQIGGISTSGSYQDNRNRRAEHTIDTLDVKERFTLAVLSRLPLGPGEKYLNRRNWESAVLSNINFNTILTLQGGTPLAISGASNYTANRPNFSGINPLSDCANAHHHTPYCWFNPAAFVNPPDYTYGNVPRTLDLRGPGAINVDASILKSFKIRMRYTAQLRLEGFNIFNHPNFSNPNTSFTATLPDGQMESVLVSTPPPVYQSIPAPPTTANTNGNFGQISSAGSPRIFQGGLKFTF